MNGFRIARIVVLALALAGLTVGFLAEKANADKELKAEISSGFRRKAHLDALNKRLEAAEAARVSAEERLHLVPEATDPVASGGGKNIAVDIDAYPEYRAWDRKQREKGYLSYARYFPKELPTEKADRVKSLLVEVASSEHDAVEAGAQLGIASNSDEGSKAQEEAAQPIWDEIKAVLGDDGYKKLVDNDRLSNTGYAVSEINLDMAEAGVAFSEAQKAAMNRALADIAVYGPGIPASASVDYRHALADPATGLTPMNQALFDKASPALSPQQVQVLRQYVQEDSRFNTLSIQAYNQAVAQQKAQGAP